MRKYLADHPAAMLAYDESDNEILIITFPEQVEKEGVYPVDETEESTSLGSAGFLRNYGLEPEDTRRYSLTWDEGVGPDSIPGGLIVDMDQTGELVQTSGEDDSPAQSELSD